MNVANFSITSEINKRKEKETATAYIELTCPIIELIALAFYVPTLTNYLKDRFNIQTSMASLFFLVCPNWDFTSYLFFYYFCYIL